MQNITDIKYVFIIPKLNIICIDFHYSMQSCQAEFFCLFSTRRERERFFFRVCCCFASVTSVVVVFAAIPTQLGGRRERVWGVKKLKATGHLFHLMLNMQMWLNFLLKDLNDVHAKWWRLVVPLTQSLNILLLNFHFKNSI